MRPGVGKRAGEALGFAQEAVRAEQGLPEASPNMNANLRIGDRAAPSGRRPVLPLPAVDPGRRP